MGYSTPHEAREYFAAAALFICHDYVIRCQRRQTKDKKLLLKSAAEIDLCARLAAPFGPTTSLAAQGKLQSNSIDLIVSAPRLRAEVKYFRPPARNWSQVKKDWTWLLSCTSAGGEFKKRAWVVFWPSVELYAFTNCLSVPKTHGTQYSLLDFAPFAAYAEPEVPANGTNQRLRFKQPERTSILSLPGGKAVRVEVVGNISDPLWCAVYSRCVAGKATAGVIQINNTPLAAR
jgi:hypothetical protein